MLEGTAPTSEGPGPEGPAPASSSTPLLDQLVTVNPYLSHPSAFGAETTSSAPSMSSRVADMVPPMPTLPAARVKAAAPYPDPPVNRAWAFVFFLEQKCHKENYIMVA